VVCLVESKITKKEFCVFEWGKLVGLPQSLGVKTFCEHTGMAQKTYFEIVKNYVALKEKYFVGAPVWRGESGLNEES